MYQDDGSKDGKTVIEFRINIRSSLQVADRPDVKLKERNRGWLQGFWPEQIREGIAIE